MKKLLPFICFLVFIPDIGKAQKPLSQAAINDFAKQAYFNYKYGSDYFKATVNTVLSSKYNYADIAVIMEDLKANTKGREVLFEGFNSRFCGSDNQFLFQQLYSLDMKAVYAKEVADYIFKKYSVSITDKADDQAKKYPFFTGTKKFTDGEAWDYVLTISNDSFSLKLYPSKANTYYKDKSIPKEVIRGIVKDGKMCVKRKEGYDCNSYKLEDGILSEINNEGTWNDYPEASSLYKSTYAKVEQFYLPNERFNKVVYDMFPKKDAEKRSKQITQYNKTSNGYDIYEATYFDGKTVSILKSSIVFQNNEVKLLQTTSTNFMETNKIRNYSPQTLLKVPPKGGTVKWIYNTNKEDKYKNICTASWATTWIRVNGVDKQIDVIKVEKVVPDLKGTKEIEYYRKGDGLVKVEIVSKNGKEISVLRDASEWSKEDIQ